MLDSAVSYQAEWFTVKMLSMCKVGEDIIVSSIGASPAVVAKLSGMGIYPNSRLTIVGRTGSSIVVLAHNSRIAINKHLASMITCHAYSNG